MTTRFRRAQILARTRPRSGKKNWRPGYRALAFSIFLGLSSLVYLWEPPKPTVVRDAETGECLYVISSAPYNWTCTTLPSTQPAYQVFVGNQPIT